MYYSLFVFCFYYKIRKGLSFKNLTGCVLAGRGLTRGPGLGQTLMVWVGPGPEF